MELKELLDKIPPELRPVAVQYGPALLEMTAAEIWAWIEMLIAGQTAEAYQAVIDRLPMTDKLAMMSENIKGWNDLNTANAAKLAMQREAALAVLRAMLMIALAMVGL